MTRRIQMKNNKQRIIHLFQRMRQPASCYHEFQLMDEEEQRYVEHILTTINTKGYMPA